MAAFHRDDLSHLQADCQYTGIISGPNGQYRVGENLLTTYLLTNTLADSHLCAYRKLREIWSHASNSTQLYIVIIESSSSYVGSEVCF